jgi:hypothetical protein
VLSNSKSVLLLQPEAHPAFYFMDYRTAYNELPEYQWKPMPCWNNLYIKMLFALQKTDSRVNLLTLNRAQIYAQDLPCKSIKAAIEAGLLPEVANYRRFDSDI